MSGFLRTLSWLGDVLYVATSAQVLSSSRGHREPQIGVEGEDEFQWGRKSLRVELGRYAKRWKFSSMKQHKMLVLARFGL